MRRPRDFRGMTALVLALGVQANLITLIVTEGDGANHTENTIMAMIFGAALAAISAYMAGARPPWQADGKQPTARDVVTAPPTPTPAPAAAPLPPLPHRSTPRRIPTGETPAVQGGTTTATTHDGSWPPPPIRDQWGWPGTPGDDDGDGDGHGRRRR